MNPISPARIALAAGLIAGAWLIPSAPMAAAGAAAPAVPPHLAGAPNGALLAQAGAAPTDRPVTYSEEQANRGAQRYERDCVECHGSDLGGGLIGGPPLRGVAFDEKFGNGAPVSALFAFTSAMMPPDSPGRYNPSVYADLVAFILRESGYSVGEALPSDFDALDHLIMEK